MSMGFRVILKSQIPRRQRVLTFIEKYDEKSEVRVTLDGSLQEGHASVHIVGHMLQLSEKVSQDVFFQMKEPSIENTAEWAEWWDQLVASRARCESM